MDFSAAKWIWVTDEAGDNTKTNDRVLFRKKFSLDKPPKSATVYACALDCFNMFVNGKPVAFGIRGCESYDIAKLLTKGDNVIGFDCLYYGVEANGYKPTPHSGLIVACPELNLYSNAEFTACRPYSCDDGEPHPSGRFRGFNSYTDGGRNDLGEVFTVNYGSTLFVPATEVDDGSELADAAPVNYSYNGVIKVKKMTKTTVGVTNTYECEVGGEKTFYPVIELTAMGTERIEIKSEKYNAHEKWGRDGQTNGVRGVYICRNGQQKYMSPIPISGNTLVIVAPATVSIKYVDLYEVSYPIKRVLDFTAEPTVKKLVDKCDQTMRACMADGVIDNSDRDRGMNLFALSTFTRSALLTYSHEIVPLILFAIERATVGDSFVNNAASPLEYEDPTDSLMFCSQFGAIAQYYYATGDEELVKKLRPRISAYLSRWDFNETELTPRVPDGTYVDAGYNVDETLVQTCLYYSAASFIEQTEAIAESDEFGEELKRRAALIRENFISKYYKKNYFSSGDVCDERANALAVLTGLAGDKAATVKDALRCCRNASPCYESFVIEALGKIGSIDEALSRLIHRYSDWVESDAYVLPEYFFGKGSLCSTLPVAIVAAYVNGILGYECRVACKPQLTLNDETDELKLTLPFGVGTLNAVLKKGTLIVENDTGYEIAVNAGGESSVARKGKTKIVISK